MSLSRVLYCDKTRRAFQNTREMYTYTKHLPDRVAIGMEILGVECTRSSVSQNDFVVFPYGGAIPKQPQV